MRCLGLLIWLLALRAALGAAPIVVDANAGPMVRLAGRELAAFLGKLYPEEEFAVVGQAPARGDYIRLGAGRGQGVPDSFSVTTSREGGRTVARIEGADERGTLYAVYALLEELGYDFNLSYTGEPEARPGRLSFDDWQLKDAPLFRERFVFDWHNFLSSASTWEYEDWQHYIDQAARMQCSGIMVHAYGNNPMFTFTHNGVRKPVGYLSTTQSGRDWGTEHVNDVRRLYGAKGIFEGPVFGSNAAMVPDEERAEAAMKLMQKVFDYAESRGMEVHFALDVDTLPANPQEIIRTLPEDSRFRSGDVWLPDPEAPGGREYFTSLIRTLLETYPQIDQLVVWYRRGRTPWMNLQPEDFPAGWRERYERGLGEHPGLEKDPYAPSMFAIGRIVEFFGHALDEAGRPDIRLATGTWDFASLRAADAFFPPAVTIMALDWSIEFESAEVQETITAVSANRPMIPILWAHHDDHAYIGRPYTPFRKLASTLEEGGADGLGIIHWTTRPLDLYFKSTMRQVWETSKDEDLAVTCRRVARGAFGPEAVAKGASYLMRFVTEAPMFGRETTDRFIDRPLGDTHRVGSRSRARREILDSIDRRTLTATGFDQWMYFRQYEQFIEAFYLVHNDLERSQAALRTGDRAKAVRDIKQRHPVETPEWVLERYAMAAGEGAMTRGEKALLISMNLRWLPYFRAQKQVLGLDLVRVNFQETQHDPLAQGAGHNTFFFDEEGKIWQGLGEKETGLPVAAAPEFQHAPKGLDPGLFRSGLDIREPATLELTALAGVKLLPGEYTVRFLFLDQTGSRARVVRAEQMVTASDGKVAVKLQPLDGRSLLCALVIDTRRGVKDANEGRPLLRDSLGAEGEREEGGGRGGPSEAQQPGEFDE